LVGLAGLVGDQAEEGRLAFPCKYLDDSPAKITDTFSACLGDIPRDAPAKSQCETRVQKNLLCCTSRSFLGLATIITGRCERDADIVRFLERRY
jgi:hypothetical protein